MMPQVGQDIETAKLLEWHKQENDQVSRGDIIATVESDKASFDVEAFAEGVLLKHLYEEGDEVKVLTPIAYLGEPGEAMPDDTPPVDPSLSSAPSPPGQAPVGPEAEMGQPGVKASPSAKRVARKKGIDLASLEGSGPGGRITKEDVLAAANAQGPQDTEDEVIPFSPLRTRIAERLTRSKQTIPHFTLFADIMMTEALAWRRRFNEQQGTKVTVTDLLIKATALGLKEHPQMNAHVETDRIIRKQHINIGVAVSLPDGLAVPVIADADTKSLVQISQASRQNAKAMRQAKLLSDAIGTFTVSNLGMFGIDRFVPIINPPECAILALGRAQQRPGVVNGSVCVCDIMCATLACDHRAVDGAVAAGFLETIKHSLEDPVQLGERA